MTHLISCKELVDLVADYMDESISNEARAKFEEHLSECGYCSAYVQQMHMTVKLTNQLSEKKKLINRPPTNCLTSSAWKSASLTKPHLACVRKSTALASAGSVASVKSSKRVGTLMSGIIPVCSQMPFASPRG